MTHLSQRDAEPILKKILFNRWVFLVLRVILGGVFIYAGIIKIVDPEPFTDSVAAFQILPDDLINIVALTIPVLEVAVGALLVTDYKPRLASFAALALSILFAVALSSALIRGLKIDCGCFGEGKASVYNTSLSLGRDFLLIAIAALIRWRVVASVALDP